MTFYYNLARALQQPIPLAFNRHPPFHLPSAIVICRGSVELDMGRDSAVKGRLIIGAIVGIYFLVQYLASRELDEVTGERHQFAYSVEREIEIGEAAAPKFIRENGGEASGRAADMVRRLGNIVVRNTIASKSAYPFQFHLLNDDVTINAFVRCPPDHSPPHYPAQAQTGAAGRPRLHHKRLAAETAERGAACG